MGVYIKYLWVPNCLDCTIETQAVYHHRQSIAMNTCTCCCRVGKCTLLTIMQISDRLSVIGLFWWHQYRISVHAKNPYRYTSNYRQHNFEHFFQYCLYGSSKEHAFGINSQRICQFQFNSKAYGNLDRKSKYSFRVIAHYNVHMTSKNLPGEDKSLSNCTWLAGTAFQSTTAEVVYKKVLNIKNLVINQTDHRPIPLSVCPCSIVSNVTNCYSPNMGEIFPGQTLNIELMISKQWLQQTKLATTTLIVKNSQDDDCHIVNTYQLSQTHFKHGCNKYSYTLWPANKTIQNCRLFLGLEKIPEMFFVKLKSCPKGFTLQESRKACYCDPLLNHSKLKITVCNLDDETVLRPTNSWISASTMYNMHVYCISLHCPFDYCLPHCSYISLSNPDSQCQFDRTGVLCGQCPHGLSTVFGSSQCEYCSNVYLLIILPIAIAGILLVMMLFFLNLTVANETINSLTFYANILLINISLFYPSCQPGICTIVSILNLDLGIKTCFYNGMTDYTKTWLQLAFPFYLMLIAILLIIASHYSSRVQRMTAHRALPVLATLFLLSYTKILQFACVALFQYYTVTHLPSNKTELLWSVDTTIELFGIKYLAVFIISLFLLLFLIPFNIVLLFTRVLSRFKIVNTFKPFLDTYIGPYKDKCFYWTGLLLLVRVVAYGFTAIGKYGCLLAISSLLAGLLYLQATLQPFKNKLKNVQESVMLLNLLIIHVSLLHNDQDLGLKISQILITIGIIYFIVIIKFQCFLLRCKGGIIYNHFKEWCFRLFKIRLFESNSSYEMSFQSSEITHNSVEFRDPLLALDK